MAIKFVVIILDIFFQFDNFVPDDCCGYQKARNGGLCNIFFVYMIL